MRRYVPFLVFGFGVFLLVLGPLLKAVTLPRVEVAPYDEDFTDVSTGPGTYLDQADGKIVGPVTLTVTRHTLGEIAASRAAGVAIWDISTRLDTPDSVKSPDPRQAYNFSISRWAFDRHTNQPVSCCGISPQVTAVAYMKYPFNLGKHSYSVWDGTSNTAYEASYEGTVSILGHQLYKFVGAVTPVKIGTTQVPGALLGEPDAKGFVTADEYYSNPQEVTFVDQLTGRPIGGTSHIHVTLRRPGDPVDRATAIDVSLTENQDSVQRGIVGCDNDHRRLKPATTTIPDTSLAAGAPITLLGLYFAVRKRKAAPAKRGKATAATRIVSALHRDGARVDGAMVLGVGAEALEVADPLREAGAEQLQANVEIDDAVRSADLVGESSWLPFQDKAFDVCVTGTPLDRFADPDGFIAELVRVTRLGGHVCLLQPPRDANGLGAAELARKVRGRDDVELADARSVHSPDWCRRIPVLRYLPAGQQIVIVRRVA